MVTHPTVVVGVGQAGIRLMSKIDEVARENNDGDRFKYIAIDSDPDMLDTTPEGTTKVPLQYDEDFVDVDVDPYPYLTEDMNIGGTGAERQRPVGRYKLDQKGDRGYDAILDTLKKEIEAHHQEFKINLKENSASFNIIHIHSLGGGTGSGTFPLLVAMLKEIKAGLSSSDDVIYLAGVGVAPEITFPPQVDTPPGEPDYYPNAYAAFHDLEELTSLHSEKELSLPVYAKVFEDGVFRITDYEELTNTYDIKTVPFDDYWLVGVEEDKIGGDVITGASDEPFKERVNQTVGRSLHAISKLQNSAENWASGKSFSGTLKQTQVSVPHRDVREFVRLKQERSDSREKKNTTIPNIIDDIEDRIDELRELKKNLTIEQVGDDDLEEEIDEWLDDNDYRTGSYIIDNKQPEEIREDLKTLAHRHHIDDDETGDVEKGEDKSIEKIIESAESGPADSKLVDKSIEAVIIASEKIINALDEETAAPRVKKKWESTVDNLWQAYRLDNPRVGDEWGASGIRTTEGKVEVLNEVFTQKIDDYTEVIKAWDADEEPPEHIIQRLQDALPPIIGLFKSERERAEEAVEELRADRETLQSVTEEWSEVEELIAVVDQRRAKLRNDIDEKIANRNSTITRLKEKQDDLGTKIRRLDEEIDTLGGELTTERTSVRIAELPLVKGKLDELDQTTVEETLTSLSAYVENDFISEEKYERALNSKTDFVAWDTSIIERNFDWPGVSRGDSKFKDSNDFWYLFHRDNRGFQDRIDTDVDGNELFPDEEGEGKLRYLDDPYRIEFVSYTRRGPIAALRVYQDYQRLEQENTLQILANQYTSDTAADHLQAFAYMEWYGPDIQAAFDTRKPVTLPRPPELTVDCIDEPEMDDEEIQDKITGQNNWLDSYMWQGFTHDRFDASAAYDNFQDTDPFRGWKETFAEEAGEDEVGWYDFSGSTPSASEKDEWLKNDWKSWDRLLNEYAETLTEGLQTMDIEIEEDD